MRALATVVLVILGGFLTFAAVNELASGGPAHSTDAPIPDRAVDKVTVASPSWHHVPGLLVGNVTLRNNNDYPVNEVIIACDFFDEWGNQVGTRATGIRRIFNPGKTRIRGIEFIVFSRSLEGGACRTLSAKPIAVLQANDVE